MKKIAIIAIIGAAALFFFTRYKRMDESAAAPSCNKDVRSVRNNNPGNLVKSSSKWKGKVPHSQNTDTRFEQFESWGWGTRAMLFLIRKYLQTNRNTIQTFLASWAGTTASGPYGQFMQQQTGWGPNEQIAPTRENIKKLGEIVSRFEGGCTINEQNFNWAWARLDM